MTETIIVVLIVLWSIWVTLRRFFSAFVAQQQQRLANIVARQGWTNLSKILTPAISGGGCDSGCSSCSSRCSTLTPAPSEQVVRWRH